MLPSVSGPVLPLENPRGALAWFACPGGIGQGQPGAHGEAARLLRHTSDPPLLRLCASVPAVPEGGKPPAPSTNELFHSISPVSALKHKLRATVAFRLTLKAFS